MRKQALGALAAERTGDQKVDAGDVNTAARKLIDKTTPPAGDE